MAEGAIDLLEGHRLVENAPKILHRAIEKCARMLGKVTNFIELVGGELLPQWQRRRIPKRRAERLQAIVLTARALLKHVDLLSLRVGKPRGAAPASADAEDVRYVNPPGQAQLCEETGLSITRLRRAIKDLRRAGYLLGPGKGSALKQRRIEYTDAKGNKAWSACRVVYVMTRKFFERLNLDRRLKREQADAYRRAREGRVNSGPLLEARDDRRGWKAGSRETRGRGAPGAPTPAVARTTEHTAAPDTDERARQRMALQLKLRGAHPEWDPDRVRAEASERLKRS